MEIESLAAAAPALPADKQFRLLVDSVVDYAIYLVDRAGNVASWNAGAERIKGYSAAEVLGRPFALFYTAEERAAGTPQQLLARAEREGRAAGEGWRVRKDGSRFWADVVVTALRTRSGELAGFAKVTRDTTAWREANARVEQSERLLRAFTDHSPAMMFLKDAEGRYRFVNQRFLQLFGLRREEVIGRSDPELFPAEQARRLAASDARVLERAAEMELEETATHVDGTRVYMVTKFPTYDAAGGVSGVGAVASDISARKRAEQALAEREMLLAQAQSLAGLGCWEWEPASGRVSWSETLYRIYGVERASFEPSFEAYLERLHPADRERTAALVARALAEGRGFTHEERIVRPDGSERVVRTHGQVVRDAAGRVVKMVGACIDITESRAHQEALQALTRRLVEAEEAERRRIAAELHDRVAQDLSALNINLDIVLGALDDGAPTALARRLRDSLALVDGTLHAIEDVMADLRPPLLEEYGLGAALRWHAEQFSRTSGIEVELHDDARQHNRKLRRDAAVALFRIAQEGLANVAKHACAPRALVRLTVEAGHMVLTVKDAGCGFDPQNLGVRASRWGMATMKERALAAGGSLELSSEPGRGTTLAARVPL